MAAVTTYNLTIDDTSPQIVYLPPTLTSATPDLLGGWNEYYNGTGFSSYLGQTGLDASWHVTSRDGAALSIGFTGTAISVYGQAIASSFSVSVDGASLYEASGSSQLQLADAEPILLASFTGLSQKDHVLTLTFHSLANGTESAMIFDRAVVTVSTGLTDAAVTNQIINNNDTSFKLSGSWALMNRSGFGSESWDNKTYHITHALGDQAQYTFQGSSVELSGLTNASSGLFSITLNSDSSSSNNQQQQLSGQSSFLAPATLFYASGLARDATHTLTVTNLENKTLTLSDLSITVVQADKSSTASSSAINIMRLSRGEVAAIAIACSLAFLIFLAISAILASCYRRRRKSRALKRKLMENPRLSVRPPTRISWSVGNVGTVAGTRDPRWSTPGVAVSYDQPAPAYDLNVLEVPRMSIREDDVNSDSGIGHSTTKKEAFVDLPTLESGPQLEHPASPPSRNYILERLSGWFTSSSSSSVSPEGRTTNGSIASPRPSRSGGRLAIFAQELGSEKQEGVVEDVAPKETYLDLQMSRTSPFRLDFEIHDRERTQDNNDQRRTSIAASLSAQARDILTSFLDFASSGGTSHRDSVRSRSRRPSTSNRSAALSIREYDKSSSPSHGQDSSGQSQNASTGAWTLSPVDPPKRSRGPQLLVPTTPIVTSPGRHPFSMVSADLQMASPTSPTESIPMSVSEINFRADDDDNGVSPVERAERNVRTAQLPRHPPLPGTPRSYDFAPVSTPQGLLDRPSHLRQMSAPNLVTVGGQRQPQTSVGRRLAQVRAQALEAQRPESAAQSTERPESTTGTTSKSKFLSIPFKHFGRQSGHSTGS